MFKTKYCNLTEEQKARGVIYSSQLIVLNADADNTTIHEVLKTDPNKYDKIANLKDVSFFKKCAKDWGWDVVNVVHR